MTMKPGHAAAFALLGWYLMMPPLKPAPTIGVLANLPLSQWHAFLSYPNQIVCERNRTSRIYSTRSTTYVSSVPPTSSEVAVKDSVVQAEQSVCVHDDDSRIDHARAKAEADATAKQLGVLAVEAATEQAKPMPPYVAKDPGSQRTPKVVVSPLPH